ncbi:PEGA domain-containing protein [Lujinxingia sediminis]|uniref:PEGA domain-containing protein n=2 Tax=Lujinxingia sediminis TaxID=2480984 RepID=A0ABY0CSM9_9DELT|nr:PEGA domain-containing protein [Lujinxingia sediminis]
MAPKCFAGATIRSVKESGASPSFLRARPWRGGRACLVARSLIPSCPQTATRSSRMTTTLKGPAAMHADAQFGKYTLIRQIAVGGMAEIWLAEQRGPGGFNKELVLKRILPHLAQEGQVAQMFLDEARMVAHLTHPNIGQVFELGELDGEYFIAMEFIDGLDLARLAGALKERGSQIPLAYAVKIVTDLLEALDYAHDFVDRDGNHVGLIHRDISPQNALISNDGVVKLVDFGVAKASINTTKTESGAVKGKFAYMAPEQIEGKPLDWRADIFSIGVLFYELLSGIKPFGEDLKAVSMILSQDPADIRTYRTDVPEELARIIARAMAKDREARFANAAEMQRVLQTFMRSYTEVVGTRELSIMVRQLRGLDLAKPTEQLFGFEKHGVTSSGPRLTTRELPRADVDRRHAPGPTLASSPAAASQIEANEPGPSGGKSVALVAGFSLLMVGLLAAFFVVGYLVIAGDRDTSDVPPASPTAAETPPSSTSWAHADGQIVAISSQPSAEIVVDGEVVGNTPFQTTLRPGTYRIELRTGEVTRKETLKITSTSSIQRFRYDL